MSATDYRFTPPRHPSPGLFIAGSTAASLPFAGNMKKMQHRLRYAMRPASNPMRIFAPTRTIFVRIPKNASNSIMAWLYPGTAPERLPHFGAEFYRQVFPAQFADYLVFAPLRHPLERFASAFTYYRHTSTKPEERRLMDEELPFLKTLEDFIAWLGDQEDWDTTRIMGWHHFRRQSDYICDEGGRMIVDLLFPVEDMEAGLRLLKDYTGAEGEVPRLNQSIKHRSDNLAADRVRNYYGEDFAIWEDAIERKVLRGSPKCDTLLAA